MKGQAVRHLKAEEGVKARVEFLHEAATSTWTTTSTDDAGEIIIPACIRARCGHTSLVAHHKNESKQRLLSRHQVRDLCPYCGYTLDKENDIQVKGKALRNMRKHLRARTSRQGQETKRVVLKNASKKVCKLCKRVVISKTVYTKTV